MSESYSPDLRITLIGDGDLLNTWGDVTNTNLGTLIEQAIAGNSAVSVTTANQAFTAVNGATDQSRMASITLSTTIGAAFTVYAPPNPKLYVIYNSSLYTATIYNSTAIGNTTAAGAGIAIPAGGSIAIWSDGTNMLLQNSLAGIAVPTQGGVAYGTGTNMAYTPVGTTGQVLVSNGSAPPTWGAAYTANAVTFNNSGSGVASGTSFNGSAAETVSYNTLGAAATTGTNASGTWPISVTGSSASTANITGGTANQLNVQTAANTTGFVTAPSTAGTYLEWSGSALAWVNPTQFNNISTTTTATGGNPGSTYWTNTTGKPALVMISGLTEPNTGNSADIYVNGNIIGHAESSTYNGSNGITATFMVPIGVTAGLNFTFNQFIGPWYFTYWY